MAIMSASLEESLRCSKLSSHSRASQTNGGRPGATLSETDGGENINERFLRERDSFTLDCRVEQLKSTERTAKTKQRLKVLESSTQANQGSNRMAKMPSEVAKIPSVSIELSRPPALKTETCVGQSREESL